MNVEMKGKKNMRRFYIHLLPWVRLVAEDGRIVGWYNPRRRKPIWGGAKRE